MIFFRKKQNLHLLMLMFVNLISFQNSYAEATVFEPELLLKDLDLSQRTISEITDLGFDLESPIKATLRKIDEEAITIGIYAQVWEKIYSSQNLGEAKRYTELFTEGFRNENGISFVARRLWKPPFEKEYFNDNAIENLLSHDGRSWTSNFIRILGVAEVDHPDYELETLSQSEKAFEDERTNLLFENLGAAQQQFLKSSVWSALAVQARQGEQAAIDRIVAHMKGIDEEDIFRSHYNAVEGLGYVRQPETVDLLVDYLMSERGGPKNPDTRFSDAIYYPIAAWAMRGLSQCLIDFSCRDYWSGHPTWDEVEVAREFINNYQGDWRIIGKWEPEEFVAETPEPPKVVEQTLEPEIKKPVEVIPIEIAEEPVEQSSQWWLWLIGAVVVIGGLVLMLRRKK